MSCSKKTSETSQARKSNGGRYVTAEKDAISNRGKMQRGYFGKSIWQSHQMQNPVYAAIGLDPKYEDAWLAKARTLQSLKRITEALQALDTAIELDPKNAGIWRQKGRYLIADQRYEEVLEAYEKVIEMDPKSDKACSVMGIFTGSNINMMKKSLQHSIRLQN